MKKKLLSVAVISMLSFAVKAQVTSTTPEGNIIIKGGVNFANISVTDNGRVDDANTFTSFHVGIAYDLPLAEGFSIQPGLLYTGKGAKTTKGQTSGDFYYKASSNPMYLELPINFVGKIPLTSTANFYIGAGPYAAMGITGKNKVETHILGTKTVSNKDIEFSNDDPTTSQEENYGYGKLKRFDYGLNALAGFDFARFTLGANYGYGLAKLNSGTDNTSNDKGKNRVWSVSLGIKL